MGWAQSPEVFSLARECFWCRAPSMQTLKGKQLFQKQESATNITATHGLFWSCRRCLLRRCSAARTQHRQAPSVCNSSTLNQTDVHLIVQMWPMYLFHSFFFNNSMQMFHIIPSDLGNTPLHLQGQFSSTNMSTIKFEREDIKYFKCLNDVFFVFYLLS